jgi:hypothetical protein
MTLHNDTIKGYKVFNNGLKCRDYYFNQVGSTHTYEGEPVLCESGFHFCTTLQDCFRYYSITPSMIICEVSATGYTDAKSDCSKRSCQTLTITRQMTFDEVIPHITDSHYAYYWAKYIGNTDIMIDRITNSQHAYTWAIYIGNKDIMIDRITDSNDAYHWAKDIGNKDIMIARFPEIAKRLA